MKLDTKLIILALLILVVLAAGVGAWIYVARLHARLESDERRLAQAQTRERTLEGQATALANALADARRLADLARREQKDFDRVHATFDRDRARNRKVLIHAQSVSPSTTLPSIDSVDVRPVWRRLNELFLCDPADVDPDSDQAAAPDLPHPRPPGVRAD